MSTGIQWTDETWNPIAAFDKVTGKRGWFCTRVSEGCQNCYAEKMNTWRGNGHLYRVPNLEKVELRLMPKVLAQPLSWRKPRRIFVCSMTDLFLEAHSDDWIDQVFAIMALAPQHTFQVLTKRPERMLEWFNTRAGLDTRAQSIAWWGERLGKIVWDARGSDNFKYVGLRLTAKDVANRRPFPGWPLPNVEIGTSAENQRWADERIPLLLRTPAAVRFISAEPLLGPLELEPYVQGWTVGYSSRAEHHPNCDGDVCDVHCPIEVQGETQEPAPRVDWVIVGGESGKGARACDTEWIADVLAQCCFAGVPVFVKQMGSRPTTPELTHWRCGAELLPDSSGYALKLRDSHGGDPEEWPAELRVRAFPASGVGV